VNGNLMTEMGATGVDLDCRFTSIRNKETNIGNLIADIARLQYDTDIALLNSGTLRADRILPAGILYLRDLKALMPIKENLVVLQITGRQIIEMLENGVSHYPHLEGRFPLVSGIKFTFDADKPPYKRVYPDSITIGEQPLIMDNSYSLATKTYCADGKDGYQVLEKCPILIGEEQTEDFQDIVLKYFHLLNPNIELGGKILAINRLESKDTLFDLCEKSQDAKVFSGYQAIFPETDSRMTVLNPAEEDIQ